jgi:hypothetical protein
MLRKLAFGILTLLLVPSLGAESPKAAPPEPDDMQSLFDGKTLEGWDGDPRLWEVREGVIHGETTPEERAQGNTFLIWKDQVDDFQLRFSFRCSSVNNSGVQYRSQRVTRGKRATNQWVLKGYQHEIRNSETFPNVPCFIYDEKGTRGRICLVGEKAVWDEDGKTVLDDSLITQETFRDLMKVDDWNDVVIVAEGNRIRHYLNGQLVVDFTDKHPEKAYSKGLIGLQLHAGKPMWTEFKDLRLKAL